MSTTHTHNSLTERLSTVAEPAPLLILVFALSTLSLALGLRATGSPLGTLPTLELTSQTAWKTNLSIHAYNLIVAAFFMTGIFSVFNQSDDITTREILAQIAIASTLVAIIFTISSIIGFSSEVGATLTTRPALTVGVALLALLHFGALHTRYDWLALNLAGLVIAPPLIASWGVHPLPLLVGVLIVTASLDFLAVHRSTVMESMAKSLIEFKLPVAFFAPVTATSLEDAHTEEGNVGGLSGIRLLGLGDVAIPGTFILALSHTYSPTALPVLGAILGYVIAYVVLTADFFDKQAYAGLPFLNTGVLTGAALTLLPTLI